MRPVLRPGLRLLRGADGAAVLLDGERLYRLDRTTAALLEGLDGLTDDAALLRAHPGRASQAAWARLRDTEVVVDVESAALLLRQLPPSAREAAAGDAGALLALGGDTATAAWGRRRRAVVTVDGTGAVAEGVGALLRQAGVGEVTTGPDHPRAQLSVLSQDHAPPTDTVERLVRAGRPHLVAGLRGSHGVVGPFVRPGSTCCLRCVDLARSDRDPAWAALREALSAPAASPLPRPAGAAVVAAVTALAAAEVLAHVDGRRPATLDATWETSLLDPLPRRRPWSVHPACGCGWQTEVTACGGWPHPA